MKSLTVSSEELQQALKVRPIEGEEFGRLASSAVSTYERKGLTTVTSPYFRP
jgi:hypothetical protein